MFGRFVLMPECVLCPEGNTEKHKKCCIESLLCVRRVNIEVMPCNEIKVPVFFQLLQSRGGGVFQQGEPAALSQLRHGCQEEEKRPNEQQHQGPL